MKPSDSRTPVESKQRPKHENMNTREGQGGGSSLDGAEQEHMATCLGRWSSRQNVRAMMGVRSSGFAEGQARTAANTARTVASSVRIWLDTRLWTTASTAESAEREEAEYDTIGAATSSQAEYISLAYHCENSDFAML